MLRILRDFFSEVQHASQYILLMKDSLSSGASQSAAAVDGILSEMRDLTDDIAEQSSAIVESASSIESAHAGEAGRGSPLWPKRSANLPKAPPKTPPLWEYHCEVSPERSGRRLHFRTQVAADSGQLPGHERHNRNRRRHEGDPRSAA